MPLPEKKKGGLAALIIAKAKPKGEEPEAEPEAEEGGEDEGLMSCADDLLTAVDEGSAKGVASALKHFIDMYSGSEASESSDEV